MKKFERKVLIIAAAGLVVRILFMLVGAKFYFNRANFYVDRDTSAWLNGFTNLYNYGTYSIDLSRPYGFFGRMPGYSFFTGIFYMLISHNWSKLYPIIALTQIALDTLAILFMYKIGEKLFQNKKTALVLAALYAFYPFIIVWTPVVYSESLSITLMIIGFYYFLSTDKKYNYALSGLILGIDVLFRPQILLLAPVLGAVLLYKNYKEGNSILKGAIPFTLLFLLSYAPWPIRNYVNYHQVVLTQDLRGFDCWNPDVISFMQYIFAVKAEWTPQFTQIEKNEPVEWPKESYLTKDDSVKLARAEFLAKNCGSGFSKWSDYWKEDVAGDGCNDEIAKIFTDLREEQIKKNPFNFWIRVPLLNFKKAVLKTSLYDTDTLARKLASLLFVYRSILIFLGLIGSYLLLKSKSPASMYGTAFIVFFFLVYLFLCAGTSPQMRNIEMRYFLPVDVLLLIPAAYAIHVALKKLFKNSPWAA